MKILGIETSCDETAASVAEGRPAYAKASADNGEKVNILSNIVSSQIEIHRKYNGVVPEVAAREHVLNILPVVNEALEKAGIEKNEIDTIAVTVGPGLVTSLITGIETAKTLSYALDIPLVAINHVEGHIYANFIETTPNPSLKQGWEKIKYPVIILTVSGGHTQLVLMEGHGKFKTIGATRDDAAGEAFDKCAKLLGLGYPGGPEVSKWAEKFNALSSKERDCHVASAPRNDSDGRVILARPMIKNPNFDFSFSGLKTSLLYAVQKDKNWKKKIPEYCHEFQQAIIDVLIKKTIKATEKYNAKIVMLAGGVSANKELRKQLEKAVLAKGLKFFKPELKYTTDNAAMVATAGYFKAKRGEFIKYNKIKVDCNLEL